ncbi:uncharacterized protein LOC112590103 [Harpegnathos saltator]|uniref:uncharacterized protein LOC112590103 n=1 Tax=Harpegnathos saltator TaxID=610380 RepID=UPI000DBED481|nr:uncharacterized protein LOC112590103 [Harpegnathos saltator]
MDTNQNINIKNRIPIIVALSMFLKKNNESDSSESNDSENEDEDISLNDIQTLFSILMSDKCAEQIVIEKITDYVDRVIPNYTNVIFKEHFRMYPATFEMILSLIGPALKVTNTTTGRKSISAEKQLYIALWFMATPDSYRYVKSNNVLYSYNYYYIYNTFY